MRKLLCVILVLVLLCAFTGCEKDNDDRRSRRETEEEPEVTKEPEAIPLVVCLDPGHGGKWTGAVYFGRNEKDIVIKLCNEIRAYLNQHYPEIKVLLTREDDTVFSTDLGTDLRSRVEFAKNNGAQILISIHLNASNEHNLRGTLVCISKQPNINGISIELANTLLARTESLGLKNRGYETRNSNDTFDDQGVPVDYYAICRHGASLDIPAIILESCFMDNEGDYAYVADDASLKRLAAAEAEGIAEFMLSHYGTNASAGAEDSKSTEE